MKTFAIPRYLVAALLSALLLTLAACTGNMESTESDSTGQPQTVTVNILGNRMDPPNLTIPVGSTVIFHNTTSAEQGIICDLFDTDLTGGQNYQYTFNNTGVWVVQSRTPAAAPNLRVEIRVQ